MALVPVIMPPVMRALTTPEERRIRMQPGGRAVSRRTRILFPIAVTLLVWTREPRRQNQLRSDLNFAIIDGLGRHGVAIPFRQQDVRVHAPALERAMTAWARRTFSPEELAAADPEAGTVRPRDELPEITDDRPPPPGPTISAAPSTACAPMVSRSRSPPPQTYAAACRVRSRRLAREHAGLTA
jgi:hypothetical protein